MSKRMVQTFLGMVATFVLGTYALWAADVIKTNNTDNLNLSSSWVGGAVPGASDVAVWDNTVTGANTVELGADLEFQGIRIENPGGLVTIGAGNTLTLGSAGIDMSSATRRLMLQGSVVLSSAQVWDVNNGLLLDSNNNVNNEGIVIDNQGHTLTVQGGGDTDLGAITGSGGIIKNGTGWLRIQSNASDVYDYTGNVTINAGTVRVGNRGGSLGSGASELTLNGGTLIFVSNFANTDYGRDTTVSGDVELLNNNSQNNGATGYTFGTLSMGEHTLTVNRNAGGTNAGNITFGATTLTGNGTFEVGNHGTDPAALNQLTLGAVGESGEARDLTKTGEGTLILASNTTYTGATDIQEGSLQLGANGTLSATTAITVHSGAELDVSAVSGGLILGAGQELGGSGTVQGDLTVGSGATLAPGNSLGALSVSNLTLAAGSAIDWEFENDGEAGVTYDQIVGAGLLTLSGTTEDKITINILGLAGHAVSQGDTFTLYAGSVTGFDADTIELVNQSDWTGGWAISDGGSLVLEAIPEPSVLWLVLTGLTVLFVRHRRIRN